MRDTLKDQSYWERMLEQESRLAEECRSKVDSGVLPTRQQIATATNGAYRYLEVLKCRFSTGLNGLREPLYHSVRLTDIGWDGSYLPLDRRKTPYREYIQPYYDHMLWLLSLAHLLDADDEIFVTLAKVIDRDGVIDVVLEFLLANRLDRPQPVETENYRWVNIPKLYGRLRQAIVEQDPRLASEALKVYVRQDWYRSHASEGWYNSHKRQGENYSGYWCWEAAAVVKLRGLDDSGFRDGKYYPKDMLTGLE